jgi:hypothetical protein
MWHVWGRTIVHTGFGRTSEGRRPLGKPKRRWEDNFKMNLFLKRFSFFNDWKPWTGLT